MATQPTSKTQQAQQQPVLHLVLRGGEEPALIRKLRNGLEPSLFQEIYPALQVMCDEAAVNPRRVLYPALLPILQLVLSPENFHNALQKCERVMQEDTEENRIILSRSLCAILAAMEKAILQEGKGSLLIPISRFLERALALILPEHLDLEQFKAECQRERIHRIALLASIQWETCLFEQIYIQTDQVYRASLAQWQNKCAQYEASVNKCIEQTEALIDAAAEKQETLRQNMQNLQGRVAPLGLDVETLRKQNNRPPPDWMVNQ